MRYGRAEVLNIPSLDFEKALRMVWLVTMVRVKQRYLNV